MLSMEQFKKRAEQLYYSQIQRHRKQLQRGAPRGVKLEIPAGEVLPYSKKEFGAWLWSKIQLGAMPCPYCSAPIDILSLEMDHMTPIKHGGTAHLTNLQLVCGRCNRIKGGFNHAQYLILLNFFENEGATLRREIEGLLIAGAEGKMTKFFNRKQASKKSVTTQPRLGLAEYSEF